MDNFTEGRVKRALDILGKLRAISELFISGYKRVTPDGEFKYELPDCFLKDNPIITISDAMGLIGELIDLWKEEAEDKKTESHALDILKRIQTEYPVYYKNVNSIEVTPSSEKLTFWYPDRDEFKDPEPELLLNKKADPCVTDGFITLNRIINNFDSYENVRLEKGFGGLDGVYLKFVNKDNGCSYAFQFGDFIKGITG